MILEALTRFWYWRRMRKWERHLRWMRKHHVVLPKPQRQCQRPGPEAPGKVTNEPQEKLK